MNPEEIVINALKMAQIREKECPFLTMYSSIVEQLIFLKNYINGKENNKTKLNKLMFGVYAAKELEETDPEFTKILSKAFYIATQKQKGLKIDTSILNE